MFLLTETEPKSRRAPTSYDSPLLVRVEAAGWAQDEASDLLLSQGAILTDLGPCHLQASLGEEELAIILAELMQLGPVSYDRTDRDLIV